MVIINNISDTEWRLILSALECYKNDKHVNMVFGKGIMEELNDLINKVENFTGNSFNNTTDINFDWEGYKL